MHFDEYPAQEPLAEFGRKHLELMARRNAVLLSKEFSYGDASPSQSLLAFLSSQPNAPLLIFFHGGGWTNGYKEYAAFMGPLFAQSGISFVTAGYRLAPENVFPTGWDDCANAVKWCFDHSDRLNVAREKIFVGGFSAGAHYASLLATRQDWQAGIALPKDVIRGCLSVSGSYRFDAESGFAMRPRFLGPVEANNDNAASPLRYVSKACAPFHVAWGEFDFPHLIRQGKEFAQALADAGADVSAIELPECDHLGAGAAAGEIAGPWFASARGWIQDRCRKG